MGDAAVNPPAGERVARTPRDGKKEKKVEVDAVGAVLKERWRITDEIGSGGFGKVYKATDGSRNVAVKCESVGCSRGLIKMEVAVLKELQGERCVVKFYGCGRTPTFNYLLMGLVGPSLSIIRKNMPMHALSPFTLCEVARQMLAAIRCVHSHGILHRDIKPSNFAVGASARDKERVYIFDFGLSRIYLNKVGAVRAPRKQTGFRGTARYASLQAHDHHDLGRVDDLWSYLYTVCELGTGGLPWHRLKDKKEIAKAKRQTSVEKLTHGMHPAYRDILPIVGKGSYDSEPDYDAIGRCLDEATAAARASNVDIVLDWLLPPQAVATSDGGEGVDGDGGGSGGDDGCRKDGGGKNMGPLYLGDVGAAQPHLLERKDDVATPGHDVETVAAAADAERTSAIPVPAVAQNGEGALVQTQALITTNADAADEGDVKEGGRPRLRASRPVRESRVVGAIAGPKAHKNIEIVRRPPLLARRVPRHRNGNDGALQVVAASHTRPDVPLTVSVSTAPPTATGTGTAKPSEKAVSGVCAAGPPNLRTDRPHPSHEGDSLSLSGSRSTQHSALSTSPPIVTQQPRPQLTVTKPSGQTEELRPGVVRSAHISSVITMSDDASLNKTTTNPSSTSTLSSQESGARAALLVSPMDASNGGRLVHAQPTTGKDSEITDDELSSELSARMGAAFAPCPPLIGPSARQRHHPKRRMVGAVPSTH